MRIVLTFLSFLFLSASANAVKLHDLTFRLSYEKHVFPGRLLRGDIDESKMMVQAVYYYQEALFTGTVTDTSLEFIEIVFDQGKITSYRRDWDASNYYRYTVTSSERYSWYASDITYSDGEVQKRSEYLLDSTGTYRMSSSWFYLDRFRGDVEIARYVIGSIKGKKVRFHEKILDGTQEFHSHNGFVTIEQYRLGERDGLYEQRDSSGNVVDRVFYSSDSQCYVGEYLHVDVVNRTKTIGSYRNGYPTGVWVTRRLGSEAVIECRWFNADGMLMDSAKTWNDLGYLSSVTYNTLPASKKAVGPYYAVFYPGGALQSIEYFASRDTLHAKFNASGQVSFIKYRSGKHLVQKSWFPNSSQIQYERYFVWDEFKQTGRRDSVWREWNESGELISEKFYASGKYLSTSVDKNQKEELCPGDHTFEVAAGISVLTENSRSASAWDTSLVIPSQVLDSVAKNIQAVWCYARESNPSASVSFLSFDSTFAQSGQPATIRYVISFEGLDSCYITPQNRCHTNNARLNCFLDSLDVHWSPYIVTESTKKNKRSRRKTTHHVGLSSGSNFLNVSYIQRRLRELQTGSDIELNRGPNRYPANLLYIPQGTVTNTGTLPFTVIAIAATWHPFVNSAPESDKYWTGMDGRIYYTYVLYGDGEIEHTGFTTLGGLIAEFDLPE